MDHLAQQLIGGQYLSFERLLFAVFPPFFAILLHKVMVVSFSLIGAFLLFSKTTRMSGLHAFLFATLYSVYNPYAVFSSIHHGMGYAAIPLAIYVFFIRIGQKNYNLGVVLLSFLLAISSVPTHSLMTLFFGLFIWYVVHYKEIPFKKMLATNFLLMLFTLANWGHAILAMKKYGEHTSRVLTTSADIDYTELFLGSLFYIKGKTDIAYFGLTFSLFLVLFCFIILFSLVNSRNESKRWYIFTLLALFSSSAIYLVTFNVSALSFLNAVNFHRISYLLPIPMTYISWEIFQKVELEKKFKHIAILIPGIFLSVALATHLERKSSAIRETLIQNQKQIQGIENLRTRPWEPKDQLYRVVTASLPYKAGFHPNLSWVYGLETLDGYSNLVPHQQIKFWFYGIHRHDFQKIENFGGGNLYISYQEENPYSKIYHDNPEAIEISSRTDINLLRMFNVGYILSATPLNDQFSLVSKPMLNLEKPQQEGLKERILTRISRLTTNSELYIYSIGEYSPRAYFPQSIFVFPDDLNTSQKYRYISKNYCPKCAFVEQANKDTVSSGIVKNWIKIKNGYQGDIEAQHPESLVVLGQFIHPYWKAFSGGRELPIIKVNEVQMGVLVPAGQSKLKFIYSPPY
jgi:hypothetical protein